MAANNFLFLLSTYFFPAIFVLLGISFLRAKYNGLQHIPGPPIAAFTKFWRFFDVHRGHSHLTAIALHRKYGKLVRIAPNIISVADPEEIATIYSTKGDFTKSAFYPIQSISWQQKVQVNLFSTRSEAEHRDQRKKIANAYTLESLLKMESAIDDCSRLFLGKMGEYADRGEPVDLGKWLQFYGETSILLAINQSLDS
jgi:hypothetical protein